MIFRRGTFSLATVLAALAALPFALAQARKPTPPKSLRLYVLDCGKITVANGARSTRNGWESSTVLTR